MFKDKYEKEAAKVLALLCLGYSIVAFIIGVGVTSLLNDWSKISIFFEGYGLLLFIHYLIYYRANIKAHRTLISEFGQSYIDELDEALSDKGLRLLLYKRWFVDKMDFQREC